MAVHFKVFLTDGDNTEARRFTVDDASVVTNFLFMKEKLYMVFPVLRESTFRITWRDQDGDQITIAGDEDLITALTEMANNMNKTLYINILEKIIQIPEEDDDEDEPQACPMGGMNIICDNCNTRITAYRYKCMECPDYDLCATCEHKGLHSHHIMMRTSQVDLFSQRTCRRLMHHVMKSFKKAQYSGRESGRFGRHGHGHRGFRQGKDQNKTEEPAASATQAGQQQSHPRQHGCPMNTAYEAYLEPLLGGFFPKPPQNTTQGTGNEKAQPDVNFVNVINGAINSFLEGMANMQAQGRPSSSTNTPTDPASTPNPAPTTTPTQQPTASTTASATASAPASVPTSSNNVYPQVPTKDNTPVYTVPPTTPSAPASSAMDVETATNDVILVDLENNKAKEPGWMYVTQGTSATAVPRLQQIPQFTFQATPQPTPQPTPQATPQLIPISVARSPQDIKIAEGLKQLLEMGFGNELKLVALLKRFDGSVGHVVKHLFENPQ